MVIADLLQNNVIIKARVSADARGLPKILQQLQER